MKHLMNPACVETTPHNALEGHCFRVKKNLHFGTLLVMTKGLFTLGWSIYPEFHAWCHLFPYGGFPGHSVSVGTLRM